MNDGEIVARITHDYIAEPGQGNHVGLAFIEAVPSGPKVRFRLKDDDDIVYYKGWLYDDDEGDTQFRVLEWAQRDSGCTYIEIWDKEKKKWTQIIG